MLVASTFDDIIAITMFGVSISFAFDGVTGSETKVGMMILNNFLYIIGGMIAGCLVGLSLTVIKSVNMHIKATVMIIIALSVPWITHICHVEDSKYIGIIFFGYACARAWGKQKPDALLAKFWKYCAPFVFATIGASI